jgi:hypothetical protein
MAGAGLTQAARSGYQEAKKAVLPLDKDEPGAKDPT